MTKPDFTTAIVVDQSPEIAFRAVTNVRGWWSEEIEGKTAQLNDEFEYHYEDVHRCKIRLIEVIPERKVVWHVLDNYFKFTKDEKEWTDTKMIFEIAEKEGKTEVRLTHEGLVPEFECFDICRDSWSNYIQHSLYGLITTGKGKPNGAGKPQTQNEERLGSKEN